ncbi:tannase/feruloyl esterase family alpha/beta hydrolase [Rouxiella sp. Mn2063]|uniref:tannase/feruloyl esterase family alpha/beta hydrolase n=1 Tax=Rouxiella sp. Mn2063 TaxID=3395262 RepID=UPI003BBB71B5
MKYNKLIYITGLLFCCLTSPIVATAAEQDFREKCLSYEGPDIGNQYPVISSHAYFVPKNSKMPLKIRDRNTGELLKNQEIKSDLCLLKIILGPGAPGDKNMPSTSTGIGVEIWLPVPDEWNQRYIGVGQDGFAGGIEVKAADIVSEFGSSALRAAKDGYVSAAYDAGHAFKDGSNGSFGLRTDGSVNWPLLQDWAYRGLHGMTLAAKQAAQDFYGKKPKFSYWNGGSTGGREGLMLAQRYPADYNGIISAYPAINWPSFATGIMWPQIVMQQELGHPIEADKLDLVTQRAIRACDTTLTGQHEGYLSDIHGCNYNPLKDKDILCESITNTTKSCLSQKEALAVNKIWFGPTMDGNYIDPAKNNGVEKSLSLGHLWYGYNRGAILFNSPVSYGVGPAGITPFTIGAHWLSIVTQDPSLADNTFVNEKNPSRDGWKKLPYSGEYSYASIFIRSLQQFGSMNGTDSADLREFSALGGKIIHWHGLADNQIPVGGSINYYERILSSSGGLEQTRRFYRFYLAPGLGHGRTGAAGLNPPTPGGNSNDGFGINYALIPALEKWVEKGVAPESLTMPLQPGETSSRSWCLYPQHLKMIQGGERSQRKFECVKDATW